MSTFFIEKQGIKGLPGSLTNQFDTFSSYFLDNMSDLLNMPEDSAPAFARHVPIWQHNQWRSALNNCYNFVLNRPYR